MIHILFVCLGNICRSPMAEAVLRHKIKQAGLEDRIEVDSAGTGNWHIGKPPHHGTLDLLREQQIDSSGMTARQVTPRDLTDYDYIIAMDSENLRNLEQMAAAERMDNSAEIDQTKQSGRITKADGSYSRDNIGYIAKLLDFVPDQNTKAVADKVIGNAAEQKVGDVPDPYYTGKFSEVFELVDRGCEHLLAHVLERENLLM